MKRVYIYIIMCLLPLGAVAQKKENTNSAISRNLELFNDIYKQLDLFYVDSLNADTVIGWGIRSMLQQVDPFTDYYPDDDGEWKFGDESRNGPPHHYPFDAQALQTMMDQAASTIQLDIYGGDCIIQPDGRPVLIDLNDWPSFSRCRDEAAQAIAERISEMLNAL